MTEPQSLQRTEAEIAATIAKLEAETEQARADARRAVAEAAKLEAEARSADISAKAAAHNLEDAEYKRALSQAANEYHRVYVFNDQVSSASVRSCLSVLTSWHRVFPGEPMEIVFNSPGGSIIDGLALYDYIQELRRSGHHITTSSLGMAASMAGILLQAGDRRVMSRESWLLIHEAAFMTAGKFGDIEDTVGWVKRIQERVLDIFAERSKLTKTQLRNRWHRKDWWISSDEALKWGLIDEVR